MANKKDTSQGPRVGVVLCGAGRFDGSEITEATLTLLHLDRAKALISCFAPDSPQWSVCEHFGGGGVPGEERNMLVESARIARGEIQSLKESDAGNLDALIIPGGSGVVRNLCNFAEKGAKGEVHVGLARLIRSMHAAHKPIGAICIAPAVLALALGAHKPRLTLGPSNEGPALDAAMAGAEMEACDVGDIIVDNRNNLISTPAYILGQGPAEVNRGIELLVKEVLKRIGC
ncbi:MAG TPA: isoprenoid biosynthesis protein ElbB [Planctomycetes bacterium]|nr:isoprenoid biosynthesis protein ElbB [Planctomycetota bacterium]